MNGAGFPTKIVRGVCLRADPPREAAFGEDPSRDIRFEVKNTWQECCNLPVGHPLKMIEFLHRQMNEEINSLEISARALADFPDAPWDLRLRIARQCADEARHVTTFRSLVERRGGFVGAFPVLNFQYRIVCSIPTLEARLAVQNKSFEAGGKDALAGALKEAEDSGDSELRQLFEFQEADEITHVRFANEYLREAIARNPRVVLDAARALTDTSGAFAEVFGSAANQIRYDVSTEARTEAGFLPDEIRVVAEMLTRKRAAALPR
jgi:uncharacterized ferritin-like protein (DUF455 family)